MVGVNFLAKGDNFGRGLADMKCYKKNRGQPIISDLGTKTFYSELFGWITIKLVMRLK